MFEDVIEYLKPLLDKFNLLYRKVNNNLSYFESEKYNIAFDLVKNENFISIDFVYRRGLIVRDFINLKYPNIEKNKCRIFTALNTESAHIFYEFIKTEFLELVYFYNEVYKNKYYSKGTNNQLIYADPLKFWFADGVPNFGDFITPWLASHLTNRPVMNVRNLNSSEGAILGVGSIVQAIGPNHRNIKIWGSGIISSENHISVANKLKKSKLEYVYACRGELTKSFFKNYDFNCSNILGDPGLLFGSLYLPRKTKKYKYAIIPHYIHYQFFKDLNVDNCIIVDVRQELTLVIDQIASSEKCISTSMHGLIIAQSYNIPWLHLYISDGRLLMGEDFKFNDFFSILDINKVAQEKIFKNEINEKLIHKLFNQVSLPNFKKNYSENGLIESFYECLEGKENFERFISKVESMPKILFLGDSHIGYFKFGVQHNLYKPFEADICMVSGATASGLKNQNSFTRASEKFKNFLYKYPKNSEIIFQLGEVDCGILIWLKANETKTSIEKQVQISIEAYKKFLEDLIEEGYRNISITSVTLPTINDQDHVGEIISLRRQKVNANFKERTNLTILFNHFLEEMCGDLKLNYINACFDFIDGDENTCQMKFKNKNKSDHHMDNVEAAVVWSYKVNEYLFKKILVDVKQSKLIARQNTFIKKYKFHSDKLNNDMKILINKGDIVEFERYYLDENYAYARNIKVNDKRVENSYKFIHLSHYDIY